MINAPCKDCPYRYVGCHSVCKRYAMFVEVNNQIKEKIKRERLADDITISSKIDSMNRRRKR